MRSYGPHARAHGRLFVAHALGGAGAAGEPPRESSDTPSEAAEPQPTAPKGRPPPSTCRLHTAEPPPPTPTAEAVDSAAVKEVTLDPTTKPPVCRRYVPTGSRIATEVCQSAEVTDAVRASRARPDAPRHRRDAHAPGDARRGARAAQARRCASEACSLFHRSQPDGAFCASQSISRDKRGRVDGPGRALRLTRQRTKLWVSANENSYGQAHPYQRRVEKAGVAFTAVIGSRRRNPGEPWRRAPTA